MARVDASGAEFDGDNVAAVTELDSVTTGLAGLFRASTIQARSGLQSWRARRNGAAVAEQDFGQMNLTAATDCTVRCSVFFVTVPPNAGASEPFVRLGDTATPGKVQMSVWNNGGVVQIVSSGGLSLTTVAFNTWVEIEIRWHGAGANSTIFQRVSVDNGVTTTLSETANPVANTVTQWLFGWPGTGGATNNVESFTDDIIIDAGTQGVAIDDRRYLHFLRPTNVRGGDPDAWTNVGGAANKWTAVTDRSDVTLIASTGGVAREQRFDGTNNLGAFTFPGATRANAVYLSTRDKADTTAGETFQIYCMKNGDATKSIRAGFSPSLVATLHRSLFISTTRGGGAGPWDSSALANANFQMGVQNAGSGLATDGVDIIEFWAYAEVDAAAQPAEPFAITNPPLFKILNKFTLTEAISFTPGAVIKVLAHLKNIEAFTITNPPPFQIRAKFSLTDSASLAETLKIIAKVPLTQAITLAEVMLTSVKFALSTGISINEALKVLAKFNLTDAFAITNSAPFIKAGVPLTDTIVVSQTTLTKVGFTVTESFIITESLRVLAKFGVVDSFTVINPPTTFQILKIGRKVIVLIDEL